MTKPDDRNSKLIKKKYKTPGKRTATSYRREKTVSIMCSLCGTKMTGASSKSSKSKTQKKPGRKYSGELCHRCAQDIIKTQARISAGQIQKTDADVAKQKFLK